MRDLIYVFIGGGLGSLSRYALGRWITSLHNYPFPYATLVVNILACLILGFLIGLADHRQLLSPALRLLFMVGFCGCFSTFSAFSSETVTLFHSGNYFNGLAYIAASLVLCVGAVALGFVIGK